MKEIWKEIKGYEGLYEVSNLCRVRTIEHFVHHSKGGLKKIHPLIKKQYFTEDKRPIVELSKDGRNKKYPTYRLMAIAFLPNPLGLREINHKDENPSNNIVFLNDDGTINEEKTNIEWCDRSYNINYGTRTLRSVKTKERCILAYKNDVPFMFFYSSKEAAKVLNVSRSLVSMAIHGKGKAKGLTFQLF